jgi:hypothetical protein
MATGASEGYTLISDVNGSGTWQPVSAVADSDWTIVGDDMYAAVSGYVGIGIPNPSSKLDVNGDVNINSSYKIGGSSIISNTGTYNIFLGAGAGANNTGDWNTYLGAQAGYTNTSGEHNTFVGRRAGYSNNTGLRNTFVGDNCSRQNTTGNYNTSIGYAAGYSNTAGNNNVFIGYYAGYGETGSEKLYIANGSDSSDVLIYGDFSSGQVGIGTASPVAELDVSGDINADSLYKLGGNPVLSVSSTMNTFVGVGAGENNSGNYATFIGDSTGHDNQGNCNTFLGAWAGRSNTTGLYNTFLGYAAGLSNTLSDYNTFLGYFAGLYNTTGLRNTFLGARAGWTSIADTGNVFIGFEAGQGMTGSNNLCIANSASNCIIYGDFKTGNIGFGTTHPGSKVQVAGNVEALGFTISGVPVGTSSDSYWSSISGGIHYSSGDVGIGTTSPARKLHVSDVMRLEPRATVPASPSPGDMYIDSTDSNKLKVWDGTVWQACW